MPRVVPSTDVGAPDAPVPADAEAQGHARALTEPEARAFEAAAIRATAGTIRMRDIADASGVSPSTVSRVLNNTPSKVPIAEATRERVLATARALGYRPNPLARGLRGAPTMLIGVVVRDFSDPFNASAIEALAVEAMARSYNIVLGHAHGQTDERLPLSAVLEVRHCDAVILLSDMQDQPRLLADLGASAVPVVALWQGASPLRFPTIDVDDRAGIQAGVEHLVGLGHRRIGFVSGQLPGDNTKREDAYLEAMHDRFGPIPDGWVNGSPTASKGGSLRCTCCSRCPSLRRQW